MSFSHPCAWMVQDPQSSLPATCPRLGPEDIKVIGEHPMAAGSFADIWEATYGDRRVVLKSYRRCVTSNVTQIVARLRNEVHVWTLLHDRGANVVPLVGVYSNEAHPFSLVYEYMYGCDLKQYLRNNPNVGGLKLLAGIARDLSRMHDLEIVHGRFRMANILIDKDGIGRIAGLGNASILSNLAPHQSLGSANEYSYGGASETISPQEPGGVTDLSLLTKANDMYHFAIIAWEVLTGKPPFFEMTEIAAAHSMLNGARPPRTNSNEITDQVWYIIERCWDNIPSKRMSAGQVAILLEIESLRVSDLHTSSRPKKQVDLNVKCLGRWGRGFVVAYYQKLISHFLM